MKKSLLIVMALVAWPLANASSDLQQSLRILVGQDSALRTLVVHSGGQQFSPVVEAEQLPEMELMAEAQSLPLYAGQQMRSTRGQMGRLSGTIVVRLHEGASASALDIPSNWVVNPVGERLLLLRVPSSQNLLWALDLVAESSAVERAELEVAVANRRTR